MTTLRPSLLPRISQRISAFAFAIPLLLGVSAPSQASGKKCILDLVNPEQPTFKLGDFSQGDLDPAACKGSARYKELKSFLQRTRVVFVTGYLNETHNDYAGVFKRTLDEIGGDGTFQRVNTDSKSAVHVDVENVCTEVARNPGGKPDYVILGHSKGGATALFMARSETIFNRRPCPDIAGRAKAIVSMNGVVGGSEIADSMVPLMSKAQLSPDAIRKNWPANWIVDGLMLVAPAVNSLRFLKSLVGSTVSGASLTTEAAQLRLAALKRGGSDILKQKAFCVTTEASSYEIQEISKGSDEKAVQFANFIRTRMDDIFGSQRNDGLVSLAKQFDSELCPQKMHVNAANHMSFVEADDSPISATAQIKKSFAGVLLYKTYLKAIGKLL